MSKTRDVLNRAYNAGAECSGWDPAIAEQEILDSIDPWTSVEDGLPEEGTKFRVWISIDGGREAHAEIVKGKWKHWYNGVTLNYVTHYQPIKEPK